LRTLGLITYPLYLMHNITGTAIIRVLIDAGLDPILSVWIQLGMLILICWFICAKAEPAIRAAMLKAIAYFGQLPEKLPASKLPKFARGLGLRPSVPAKMVAAVR
jgi:peptidoglycan/LPS O-acetylase OafA/YrhL